MTRKGHVIFSILAVVQVFSTAGAATSSKHARVTQAASNIQKSGMIIRPKFDHPISYSYSPLPSSTRHALSIRGGNSDASRSLISYVMRIHRFIAFTFGLTMFTKPESMATNAPVGEELPPNEKFMSRFVGSLLMALSYILHNGIRFEESAQRAIARALCVSFMVLCGLFLRPLFVSEDEEEGGQKSNLSGLLSSSIIFGGLSLGYGFGLILESKSPIEDVTPEVEEPAAVSTMEWLMGKS